MNAKRHFHSEGFTLVEALVALAILSVVAVFLFPAFSRTLDQARTTQCLSNLRMIGSAFHQYAADHDGWMPYYRPNGTPNPTWRSHIDPYLGWVKDRSPSSVKHCPLDRAEFHSNTFSYTMNYGLPGPFWRIVQIPVPSEGFLVGCRRIGSSDSGRILSNQAEPEDVNGQLGYHHQNRATLLFVDGHLEARLPSAIPRADQKDTEVWNRFWNPWKQ